MRPLHRRDQRKIILGSLEDRSKTTFGWITGFKRVDQEKGIIVLNNVVAMFHTHNFVIGITMSDKEPQDDLTTATTRAMANMPVLARLEFVKYLIFNRGGDKHSAPHHPVMVTAHEVLDGVIKEIKTSPETACLRTPEP